jgi:hypothetical protein
MIINHHIKQNAKSNFIIKFFSLKNITQAIIAQNISQALLIEVASEAFKYIYE